MTETCSIKRTGCTTALVSIVLVLTWISPEATCQTLCQFRGNLQTPPVNSWSFLENFSTSRCLKVENFGHFPNRKVVMDDCSYWKTPLREQKIYMEPSPLSGIMLKVDAGLNEKYCLTTKNGILYNTECRSKNFDQVWNLKPVRNQPNQYTVEQYSSRKCLIPEDRQRGAEVKLVPCNALQTEQIWKICTAKE